MLSGADDDDAPAEPLAGALPVDDVLPVELLLLLLIQ